MSSDRAHRIVLLSAILLLGACAPSLRLGPSIHDPARLELLRAKAGSPFPDEAVIRNEVRIVVRNEYPTFFSGQIWFRAPSTFRVQAYTEMGVMLLDLYARGDEVRSLIPLAGDLGDPRLVRGLARDMALLFLLPEPSPPYELHAVDDGGFDLATGALGNRVVYRFPAGRGRPTTVFVERNGALVARIDLADWTTFGAWHLPARLDLTRPGLDYELSVDVMAAHPFAPTQRPFRAATEGSD